MDKRKMQVLEKIERTEKRIAEACKEFGGWITTSQWNEIAEKERLFSYIKLKRYIGFSSWNEYGEKFGYYNDQPRRFSKEECIAALQKAAQELGQGLSQAQYKKWAENQIDECPTLAQICRKFGTFNEAKRQADLIVREQMGGIPFDETILEEVLNRCKKEFGQRFSTNDYKEWRDRQPDRYRIPTIDTLDRRYGLKNIRKKYGLEIIEVGGLIPENKVLSDLLEFITSQLGVKNYIQWSEKHQKTSMATIQRYGYKKMLHQALQEYLKQG